MKEFNLSNYINDKHHLGDIHVKEFIKLYREELFDILANKNDIALLKLNKRLDKLAGDKLSEAKK